MFSWIRFFLSGLYYENGHQQSAAAVEVLQIIPSVSVLGLVLPAGMLLQLDRTQDSNHIRAQVHAGPVRFFSFQSWRCKKQFQAKKKLHFWKSSNDSKKLQVKNCLVKGDFSIKWPTLVSFLIVSTGSSQSKILAWYLGYVLVCLSLAYNQNKKRIWKAMAVKLNLTLCVQAQCEKQGLIQNTNC